MYDANKQSKNGIVVSYKHIVPENKIIKIGIRKNDRKLYSMLFLTLAKQFKNQGRRIIFFTILQLVFYFYIIDY